jgi:hypothetical protein
LPAPPAKTFEAITAAAAASIDIVVYVFEAQSLSKLILLFTYSKVKVVWPGAKVINTIIVWSLEEAVRGRLKDKAIDRQDLEVRIEVDCVCCKKEAADAVTCTSMQAGYRSIYS